MLAYSLCAAYLNISRSQLLWYSGLCSGSYRDKQSGQFSLWPNHSCSEVSWEPVAAHCAVSLFFPHHESHKALQKLRRTNASREHNRRWLLRIATVATQLLEPLIMKFMHNVKGNRHFQIMSKTEKQQKWREGFVSLQRWNIYIDRNRKIFITDSSSITIWMKSCIFQYWHEFQSFLVF